MQRSRKKAKIVLGQITCVFKQYIRPHLEFAIPVWSPWTQGDIELMEKVQIRMVSLVAGLKGEMTKKNLKRLVYNPLKQDAKDMT